MAHDAEFDRRSRELEARGALGGTFKELRLKAKMSQAEAAIIAGLSLGSVRRFEMGHGDIYLSNFVRLCTTVGAPGWKVLRHIEANVQSVSGAAENAQEPVQRMAS